MFSVFSLTCKILHDTNISFLFILNMTPAIFLKVHCSNINYLVFPTVTRVTTHATTVSADLANSNQQIMP